MNQQGEITAKQSGRAEYFRETFGQSVTLDMVVIPDGKFVMGSPSTEEGRDDSEGTQRTVTVPGFFIGRFPITQVQYQAVMGKNPSYFKGANRPVERVSWNDAVAFCKKLSQMTGRPYRLPSEAEWEYACRASTTTPFHFGPTITTDLANYRGTDKESFGWSGSYGQGPKGIYREGTTEVGSFPPNAFGLFDVYGNVLEWCQDVWHENYEDAPTDGSAWREGGNQEIRVRRGGSWFDSPRYCRSAYRSSSTPANRSDFVGFRVVCAGAAGLPG